MYMTSIILAYPESRAYDKQDTLQTDSTLLIPVSVLKCRLWETYVNRVRHTIEPTGMSLIIYMKVWIINFKEC